MFWDDDEDANVWLQGKFTVTADVFDADDQKITCLRAEIQFNRRTGAFSVVGGNDQIAMGSGGSVDL